MNKDISAAIARASTLPPARPTSAPPPSDFEQLIAGPHTLASIAAALATCPHPDRFVVEGKVERGGQSEDIAWCAACGAMALVARGPVADGLHWERPALSQQFEISHFDEIERLVDAIGSIASVTAITESPLLKLEDLVALDGAIRTIVSLTLFRESKRIEHARKLLAYASKRLRVRCGNLGPGSTGSHGTWARWSGRRSRGPRLKRRTIGP